MKRLPVINEEVDKLDKVLKEQTRTLARNRIHALLLIKLGHATTRTQVAQLLRVTRESVSSWLKIYQKCGIEGLLDIKPPGPAKGQQRSIPEPAFTALKERLATDGFDSYVGIQHWLRDQWDLEVDYKTVWKIIRLGLKAKLKSARPRHAKKKLEESVRWLKRFALTLGMLTTFLGGKVRLWFQDESRFGLAPRRGKKVTAPGVKAVVEVVHLYQWLWLYGTVEPASGEHFFLEYSGLNTDCFQSFLNEFSAAKPNEQHIMVLDGASAHRAKALVWPPNVTPLYLPSYSPELNPIERVWQHFKDNLDVEITDIEALRNRTDILACELGNEILASLTQYPYIMQALR